METELGKWTDPREGTKLFGSKLETEGSSLTVGDETPWGRKLGVKELGGGCVQRGNKGDEVLKGGRWEQVGGSHRGRTWVGGELEGQ